MIINSYHRSDPAGADSLTARVMEAIGDGASLLSDATIRAYNADWKAFQSFCAQHGQDYLPAESTTVAAFLLDQAERGIKASTISRRCAAIAHFHNAAGVPSPAGEYYSRQARKVIRRKHGTRKLQKSPVKLADLKQMVDALGTRIIDRRNRAILLLGWAGGFRESELVGLTVEDLHAVSQGLIVQVRRSKSDQEGQGQYKGIPFGKNPHYCPVYAVQEWQRIGGISEGPLFRAVDRHGNVGGRALRPQAVADVVKAAVTAIGLDATRYAGHSLRAGLVTSAAEEGADALTIMLTTGHKSREMVQVYIREASLFTNNAASRAGL